VPDVGKGALTVSDCKCSSYEMSVFGHTTICVTMAGSTWQPHASRRAETHCHAQRKTRKRGRETIRRSGHTYHGPAGFTGLRRVDRRCASTYIAALKPREGTTPHAEASHQVCMEGSNTRRSMLARLVILAGPCALAVLPCCHGTMPSARLQSEVSLPVPAYAETLPSSERLSTDNTGERYVLSARSLIQITFDLQPDVKSSFQRFQSEEARHDFFYASHDSLTPRLRVTNPVAELCSATGKFFELLEESRNRPNHESPG